MPKTIQPKEPISGNPSRLQQDNSINVSYLAWNPREAVIAANYVNKKYRYVVQSVVLEELRSRKQ